MRWRAAQRLQVGDYKRLFAWLPTRVGDEWIWLEAYEEMARQHPMVPIHILPQDAQEKLRTQPQRRLAMGSAE